MTTTHTAGIAEWLASADPEPAHAHRWWSAGEVALVPVGRAWDIVRIDRQNRLSEPLPVDGPVISDVGGRVFYALVPVGTAVSWDVPGTEALGDTAYLTIPALGRTQPPGPYWLQPPVEPGHLVDPSQLRTAVLGDS